MPDGFVTVAENAGLFKLISRRSANWIERGGLSPVRVSARHAWATQWLRALARLSTPIETTLEQRLTRSAFGVGDGGKT